MALRSSYDLAQSLSDNERSTLLKKISESLEVHSDEPQEFGKAIIQKEEDSSEFEKIIASLGIFDRIIFYFKEFFLGRSRKELIKEVQLKILFRDIRESPIPLYQFETGLISQAFFNLIHKLGKQLEPLREFCSPLWSNPQCLSALVEFIIEKKIPKAKTSISQFIDPSKMQKMYEKNEDLKNLKTFLIEEIRKYVKSIPSEVYNEIEKGIIPMYLLRDVLQFEFDALPSPENSSHSEHHFLEKTNSYIHDIEELYEALDNAHNKHYQYTLIDEFFTFMIAFNGQNAPENKEQELSVWKRSFSEAKKDISHFLQRSKIHNILKILKYNPNYESRKRIIHIHIFNFYQSTLELKILDELSTQFIDIRKDIIRKMRTSVFENKDYSFDHYRRFSSSTRTSITPFRYVNCLIDLYQYLKEKVKKKHEPKLRSISRHYIIRDRDLYSNLLGTLSSLNTIYEELLSFDGEFAPLSTEGRDFSNRRIKVERDASQILNYNSFVQTKDNKAKGILDRGTRQILVLQEISTQLLKIELSLSESSRLGVDAQDYFNALISELEKVQKLIMYDRQLEEESLEKL